jgi:hypothetical protein
MSLSGGTIIAIVAIIVWGLLRLAQIRSGQPSRRELREMRRMGLNSTMLEPPGPSPRELELQHEVTELRERVKVLERIATDGRQSNLLANEIESLRDN